MQIAFGRVRRKTSPAKREQWLRSLATISEACAMKTGGVDNSARVFY